MLSDAGEKKLLTQHNSLGAKNSSCLLMQQRYGPRSMQMGVLEGIKIKSAGGCKKKDASNQVRKGVQSDQTVSFTTIFYVFLLI